MIGIEPLVNSTGVSCLQAVLSFGMCESAWNYDYSASSILFRLTTTTHPHRFRSSTHPCRINSLFLTPLPNLFWSNLLMNQQDQRVLKFPFSLIIVHSGREFLIAQLHSLESILGISLSTWGRDGGIEVKLQEKEKKNRKGRERLQIWATKSIHSFSNYRKFRYVSQFSAVIKMRKARTNQHWTGSSRIEV